jgi:hypothetical protein
MASGHGEISTAVMRIRNFRVWRTRFVRKFCLFSASRDPNVANLLRVANQPQLAIIPIADPVVGMAHYK